MTADNDDLVIACALDHSLVQERLEDWRRLAATATAMDVDATGVRLQLPTDTDVPSVAALAAAEFGCCPFFAFTLQVGPDGLSLRVEAPEMARPLVDVLLDLGAAASVGSPGGLEGTA